MHPRSLFFTALALTALGCSSASSTASSAAGTGGSTSTSTSVSTSTSATSSGTGGDGGAPAFRVALSVSPFSETLFKNGASFSDGVRSAVDDGSLQAMFAAHGANEVFTRISTEKAPTGTPEDHSEAAALARAALAKALSLPLNPELGLWSHYGDITCEPGPDFSAYPEIELPGPWPTLSVDQMVVALRAYGALVAKDLLATGATIETWDIGNEVDLGVAGVAPAGVGCTTPYQAPDGVDPAIGQQTVVALLQEAEANRIAWLKAHVWPHEARLLGAVREGVLSVAPAARFATHISQSHSAKFALAFYQAMFDGGFPPDQLGFSFYPSARSEPGRVAAFQSAVAAVHGAFARPVFIAEYAYPAGVTSTGAYASWMNAVPHYPLDQEGQYALLRDLAAWGPSAGLSGIRPWAPELFAPGWEGFALFEVKGSYPAVARKGLDGIRDGLLHPDPTAFHD